MVGSSFCKDWKAFTASGSFLLVTTASRFFRASPRKGAMPTAGAGRRRSSPSGSSQMQTRGVQSSRLYYRQRMVDDTTELPILPPSPGHTSPPLLSLAASLNDTPSAPSALLLDQRCYGHVNFHAECLCQLASERHGRSEGEIDISPRHYPATSSSSGSS
jgi:hypothetical protein